MLSIQFSLYPSRRRIEPRQLGNQLCLCWRRWKLRYLEKCKAGGGNWIRSGMVSYLLHFQPITSSSVFVFGVQCSRKVWPLRLRYHAGWKKYRTHKFLPVPRRPQMLQLQADQLQLHEHLQLQLITCHLPFTSDNGIQSFRHTSDFFVDKMLGNMGLSLLN